MKKILYMLSVLSLSILSGCATSTKMVTNDESKNLITANLSSNDFESAAQTMIDSMLENELASPKANGKPYIVKISEIENDTQQRLNMRDLTMFISKQVRRSGNVKVTNAFGNSRNTDVYASRELAESAIVDKSTVKKNNSVKAADLSLTGRISQKNSMVNNSNKLIEYTFDLELTDLSDGTQLWSDFKIIQKLTDKSTETW